MGDASRQTSSVRGLSSPERKYRVHRIFYGWWIVLTSAVGIFWGVPITVYSFSVFLRPVMQEFHAGRAAVSLGFTVQLFVAALCTPLLGWLLDRYGARRVILPSTAVFGAVLICNRVFSSSLWQFYFFYAALGFFVHGLGPVPYGYIVSQWFDRRRGLALGLMMLGIGGGAIIMPSLTQQLITRFGWHAAYTILGSAVWLVAVPIVAAFLKERPGDLGLLPDGACARDSSEETKAAHPGLLAKEAWRTATFWLLVCAFVLVSASVQGCVVHLAAMLSDRGVKVQTAALGSSLIGSAVLIGRVGIGYLLDRIFAPRLAALCFTSTAFGIGLLWLGSTKMAFAGAFLVGFGLGAEVDLIPYLTGRYFGLRAFGKIYSSAFAAFAVAGAFGPLIMGAGFDKTGSYRVPLIAFVAATLLAAVLLTRLPAYRYQPMEPVLGAERTKSPLDEHRFAVAEESKQCRPTDGKVSPNPRL
jgi:MFS family permease